MREQSHKDEMASALQADFARLRARGIETTLAPHEPPEPAVASEPVVPADPVAATEPEAVSPPLGWLARLRGR